MANFTQCAICGKEYNYCPSCSGTHAWKFYTDTHEHYQIFVILKQYKDNVCSKEDARIALTNIGITKDSDLSILKPRIAEKITEILTVEVSTEAKTVLRKARKSRLYKDE